MLSIGTLSTNDMGKFSMDGFHAPQTLGVVYGWRKIAEDNIILRDNKNLGSFTSGNLLRMGPFILQNRKHPRICGIKERDYY